MQTAMRAFRRKYFKLLVITFVSISGFLLTKEIMGPIVTLSVCRDDRTKYYIPPNTEHFTDNQYFTESIGAIKAPFSKWTDANHTRRFCDGKLKVYDDRFAEIHDVLMFPQRRDYSQAIGGEGVPYVFDGHFDVRFFCFHRNFWEIDCSSHALRPTHNNKFQWLHNIHFNTREHTLRNHKITHTVYEKRHTIAVRRQGYWNLHNVVRNIYNTFLIMTLYNLTQSDVTILLLDGHPFTNLDFIWQKVFTSILRVGHLHSPVFYENLLIGLDEENDPLTDYDKMHLPYLEEFRSFFLAKHNLSNATSLNCNKLQITVIIRRNALLSPRNNEHKVGRKIANEPEVVSSLMGTFSQARVQAVLLETLPMASQLKVMSKTDILIGMHGAGMTHLMFLPKHAAVLELFSSGFKIDRPWYICYQSMAKWRGLKYDFWENFNSSLEMPDDYTIIPTDMLIEKAQKLKNEICH